MAAITNGVDKFKTSGFDKKKKNGSNLILVSNSKKNLYFYVNLTKGYMKERNEVVLSGLGMAIASVVSVAEILKNHGLAVEKKISTAFVDVPVSDESGVIPENFRTVRKAKIEIVMAKSVNFDELVAAGVGAETAEAEDYVEQS